MDSLSKLSKKLSYILRHHPEEFGLKMDKAGWVNVQELLTGANIDLKTLDEVVENNNKQRFEFNKDKTMIRARQGHSVKVELEYKAMNPPDKLFHGTGEKNLELILQEGLRRMSRHHVHLSLDEKTAKNVGSRHGKPVILEVDSSRMHRLGHKFYKTNNDVWLVDFVAPHFLKKL